MKQSVTRNTRIGIIGLGQLAREVHLPNLSRIPGVSVTALADPAPDAQLHAARIVPQARLCYSMEELVESGRAEAVVIASPTAEHAAHAHLAIEAGLPFYLEKPIADNLPDAVSLCESAARAATPATMGFNYRFHPRVARLRQSSEESASVESQFSLAPRELPLWKRRRSTGGGVLLDLGSHHFDLLTLLVRSRVESVSARVWSEKTEEDCAEVRLAFPNGAQALCSFSFCRQECDRITLTTSRGRVVHDRYAPLTFPRWPVSGFLSYLEERRRSPWKEASFRRAIEAWIGSLRSGESAPVTLQDGLESLRVVCAAEQSSASGGQSIKVNSEVGEDRLSR